MADAQAIIRLRSDDLEWTEIDGEVVVLDLRESKYLSINRTGAAVWTALVEGATRDALLETLQARFDVDQPTAAEGLDAFLDVARERGLLGE